MTTLTPEAAQALTDTPTAELLTKAFALTHRMHESDPGRCRKCRAGQAHPSTGRCGGQTETDRSLRAMRDLITAEVLRRTGETA